MLQRLWKQKSLFICTCDSRWSRRYAVSKGIKFVNNFQSRRFNTRGAYIVCSIKTIKGLSHCKHIGIACQIKALLLVLCLGDAAISTRGFQWSLWLDVSIRVLPPNKVATTHKPEIDFYFANGFITLQIQLSKRNYSQYCLIGYWQKKSTSFFSVNCHEWGFKWSVAHGQNVIVWEQCFLTNFPTNNCDILQVPYGIIHLRCDDSRRDS